MTSTIPSGRYVPSSANGLFYFNLEPYDIQRNMQLGKAFTGTQNLYKSIHVTKLDDNTYISGSPSFSGTSVTATLNTANVLYFGGTQINDGEYVVLSGEDSVGGMGIAANGLYYVSISGVSLTLIKATDVTEALKSADTIISLAGIVLPAKSFIPRQTRYEIKTRNWLSRAVLGFQSSRKTRRVNKDGSVTEIVERSFTRRDGTKVVITEETTTGVPFITSKTLRREMTDQTNVPELEGVVLYPINATDSNGALLPVADRKDLSHYDIKKTKTVVTPPDQDIEYVHEKQDVTYPLLGGTVTDDQHSVYQGAATVRTKTTESKYIHNKEPLRLAKPVTLVSITGNVINQFILPPPPQGQDDTWWNDQMGNNESAVPIFGYPSLDNSGNNGTKVVTTTYTKDLGDGTQEVKVDVETTNPDGEKTYESTSTIRPIGDLYTPESFQTTTKEPLKTTVVKKLYDKQGNHVRTETTTTSPLHKDTNALPPATVTVNTVEDERGKKVKTTTKKWKESDGKDYEEVTEEIEELGRHVSTRSISEQIDYETNIKTVSETNTITDALGNSVTEDTSRREFIGGAITNTEEITEELEDLVLNELIVGNLVTEYQISGEFMTADQAYRLMNKHVQHQNAWAMYELLNSQLDLGDRISPNITTELFKQQVSVFTGEVPPIDNGDGSFTKKLGSRGGPVLDRMAFTGFVDKLDQSEGVVFAPGPDSFRLEWIDGTDKIFKWSMTLHKYDNLVERSDDLTFNLMNSPWDLSNIQHITTGIYKKINTGATGVIV